MRALQRRLYRLRRQILGSRAPIVWLCAGAGAGKTRLIEALQRGPAGPSFAGWSVLDAPTPRALREQLNERDGKRRPQRLLVASRPLDKAARMLLKPRLYGQVQHLTDSDLYVHRRDCASAAERAMLEQTAGWPMLVDAWLHKRSEEMRALLPQFLEREVLPQLPTPLVAALISAASMPLDPRQKAQFPATATLSHPLLFRTPSATRVAGIWVEEAVRVLSRNSAALTRAVLEELTRLYADGPDPAQGILGLIGIGRTREALEIFQRSGGAYFGYRHGYQALQRVLEAFGPEAEQRDDALFFAHEYLLIKSGRAHEALLRLEARHPGLPVDFRRMRLSHGPLAMLLRIDISLDFDETPPPEVIASWGRLQSLLPADDELARGLLLNTMAIGFMQADRLIEARQLAEEALAAYERGRSPYLSHFMHLHLCDVALRQGMLDDAASRLRRAEKALEESGLTFNSEPEIVAAFRSRIAYEEGRFADCPAEPEPLLQALLRGDSWIDLIAGTAGHLVLIAYWGQGLRKALERLDHLALTLSQRHGWTRHQRLELVRIRLLQVARRHAEAGMRLEEYDLEPWPRRSAQIALEEGLIRLRHQVAGERLSGEAAQLAGSLAAGPVLGVRQRITLGVLQAWLAHRDGDDARARRHLRIALRDAEARHLVGALAEDGEFLERLLPLLIAEPGPGGRRLVPFAKRALRLLHALPTAPMHSRGLAGVSRQEHRVLSYVADGYTNKQVARAMSLSQSTVKFHLRSLFRKLQVDSRSALAEAALQRGIVT
jgi:DNA-binding CsgD family transcriptional regulator